MIELLYPQDGARLSLLTDVQREFMEREFAGMHILLNSEYFGWGIEEMYIGEITLRWIKNNYGIVIYTFFHKKSQRNHD